MREEARRAREEAQRLRDEARDLGRRLRDEARAQRHGRGHGQASGGSGEDEPGGVETTEPLDLAGVRHLVIELAAGRLTVRDCVADEEPAVTASSSKTPPRLSVHREGDRLTIAVRQAPGWLFRRRSGATTVVRFRAKLASLRVNVSYGEIQLRDLDAATMDLDMGAGSISAYSCRGSLKANVGAGRISLHDHAGLARCETGTGDIQADIAEAESGEYRANAGMGRAEFSFPPGLALHARANSGIGRSKVEYPDGGEDAPVQVRVEAGIGEVGVKERRGDREPARPPAPAARSAAGTGPQRARRREAEEIRVLQMLEQGRISSQEAAELLAALQGAPSPTEGDGE
jgi:hypothetical protein